MVILVSTASLVDGRASYHSCCTDVLYTNGPILTIITIPVILMFCPLMRQYLLVLPFGNTSEYWSISVQNISTTGMVILVGTASLFDRTSVQQEW
jgi:hypothetical protein